MLLRDSRSKQRPRHDLNISEIIYYQYFKYWFTLFLTRQRFYHYFGEESETIIFIQTERMLIHSNIWKLKGNYLICKDWQNIARESWFFVNFDLKFRRLTLPLRGQIWPKTARMLAMISFWWLSPSKFNFARLVFMITFAN